MAGQARAQTFYLGGEAGWNVLEDQTDKATGLTPVRARFHSGYAALDLGPVTVGTGAQVLLQEKTLQPQAAGGEGSIAGRVVWSTLLAGA